MMTVLLGVAALAIDIGSAMSDRRILQAAADDAALAGARSYTQGAPAAHYVAMQYLGRALGFTLPLQACVSSLACPATTYTAGSYTITLQDATPQALDVAVTHTLPTTFAGVMGIASISDVASGRASKQTPRVVGVGYALAALSGNAMVNGGGSSSFDLGGPIYAYGSFGANNVPHGPPVPINQVGYNGQQCGSSNYVDNGGSGNSLLYQWTPSGSSGTNNTGVAPPGSPGAGPTSAGPTYTSTAAAKDLAGNWNPGTYSGIFPSGGKMNPGVYRIVGVGVTIALGAITNAILPVTGVLDNTGAVAIVLDSSDTGSLDISNAVLNGMDDLNAQGIVGPVDPQGTHNFVLYGLGYAGGVTIGPHATTNLTGVAYLPTSAVVTDGSASPVFTGALIVASHTINGSGNGTQTFNWVCGLSTVDRSHLQGGLVR